MYSRKSWLLNPTAYNPSWLTLAFSSHQVPIKSLIGFWGTFWHTWLNQFAVFLIRPLGHGIFPQLWKQANVIPVPKVQPPGSIETDLCPISLTPTLSKLLESYVGNWIMNRVLPKLDSKQLSMVGRQLTLLLLCCICGISPLTSLNLPGSCLLTSQRPLTM